MPSWITHLVTANKIKQDSKKNEFIFANIMPDILEGYHIKKVSRLIQNYETHYPVIKTINGISIPLPDIFRFKEEYKGKMQNPIIKGYYCHLLTDYFWNTYTYENYFENFDKEKRLVKIKLKDGNKKIMQWDDAVRIKQKDFNKFTNYLKDNEKIVIPFYNKNILKCCEDLKEFEFTQQDIENTILFIQEMVYTKSDKKKEEYSMFTQKELLTNWENSIQFIEEKIKE
ncbi:MAG: hypothetical protein ACI4VH_05920 [Clostridia bacterium]